MEPCVSGEQLGSLADELSDRLANETAPNDAIRMCGPAALALLQYEPDEVLELARVQLHAVPFSQVKVCWRRLYEEATLRKAVSLVRTYSKQASQPQHESGKIRNRRTMMNDWLADIVAILDMGLITVGAPGRGDVFEWLFRRLEDFAEVESEAPKTFAITPISQRLSQGLNAIPRARCSLDIDDFQQHLQSSTSPLIIPGTMEGWPAMEIWQDPNYFLRKTIGGRRVVPVEIGSSYTDADWTQRTMSFREWCFTHLLNEEADQKGYLAQHDLFEQIPALRRDIVTPDYCYTIPPQPHGATALTFGLSSTPALEEPIVNAWIGPKGTTTPLHTDAYHNILCQVLGYKYVRLYAPEHTAELRPLGVDDKGIDMSNTASADLKDLAARGVPHVEGILAPGECLYIPLGWWHYVESLSVSASVSFWWN